MKRVACYVRVSTEEQKKHGLSVDSQIQALTDYCKANDYAVAGIYNDAGISARKRYTKRPALLQLLEDCKKGKIDLIIFTKLDRWFRSVGDYYEVQKQIDEAGVKWRSIWEDYETETSSGVFKVNIMLSVAQSEADRTSERIRSVNEFKRVRGDYVGTAPTGYKITKKDLVIDENLKEAVSVYFDDYLKYRNITHAVKEARAYGLKCSKETATRMLRNPAYKGEAFGGYKCEPYLTEEQWDLIQQIKPVQKYSTRKARTYIFAGIIKCAECNKNMVGTIRNMPSGKNRKIYKYYRCRNHEDLNCSNGRSMSELKIEKYLLEHITEELNRYNVEISNIEDKPIVDNSQKILKLEAKIKRIGDRYEDGDITKEEYKAKRDMILNEISDLKQESAQIKSTPKSLPDQWNKIYADLDDEHKKLFWSAILKDIVLDHDGNITLFF